jgi:hypothetical protein
MDWRSIKQVIYGGIYLGILALIIYIIFFVILIPPSCYDGKRNQGEEGIDCGGPCPSCEIRDLAPIQVIQTVFFVDNEDWTIDLGALIKNPNVSWGIKEFDYAFLLKDAEGKELGKKSEKAFVLPGQTRWIILPKVGLSNLGVPRGAKISKAELVIYPISPYNWQKLRPFAKEASLVTKNVRLTLLTPPRVGFAELFGDIENRSSFVLNEVEAYGVLFGPTGEIVAIGKSAAMTLRPGETRHFLILWTKKTLNTPQNFYAEGTANFLKDDTFVRQFGI